MRDYLEQVEQDIQNWKKQPPNVVQQVTGFIGKPLEALLDPVLKHVTPLLEQVLLHSNDFISKAISSYNSNDLVDYSDMNQEEFENWMRDKDKKTELIHAGAVTAIGAEGAATGYGGIALLAVDIPASFGLILSFANVIALEYQLDITDEQVQLEILKAISAGSATNIGDKTSALATLKISQNVISKTTWKAMGQAPVKSLQHQIIALRQLLKSLGVNVTKRKALQTIPVLSAVTGGIINASWATDALQAVRQYSREVALNNYRESLSEMA